MNKAVATLLITVLCLVPARTASSQEKPTKDTADKIVDTLAAQWAAKALNLKLKQEEDVLELALFGQTGTIEQRMARCMALANSRMPLEKQLALELLSLKRLSQELVRLKLQVETHELKGHSEETIKASLNVEFLRLKLSNKAETLDVMNAELAQAIAHAELLANKAMTAELAASLVKYNVARVASLTKDHQKAMSDFELLMNEQITPTRAAFIVTTTAALEAAKTKELEESRGRVKDLLQKALAKEPNAEKAFTNAGDITNQAASEELLRSRKQVQSRIEAAKNK